MWSRDAAVINAWGDTVRAAVAAFVNAGKGHGAFLSSCSYHCQGQLWGSIQILGDTAATAFASWYNSLDPLEPLSAPSRGG